MENQKQSLSSLDFYLGKKLKSDDENGASNVFYSLIMKILLRWVANGRRCEHHHRIRHRRRHYCFRFMLIMTLLSIFALFLFLSPPFASMYQIRRRLVMEETGDVGGGLNLNGEEGHNLWKSKWSDYYVGCSNASRKFLTANVKTHPNRYILISTSGGLNQQRTGIIDSVVAAYILNATLVVPILDQNSYWKDTSDFNDIFDLHWFISFLSEDVKIIKQLPSMGGKGVVPVHVRVPRKCTPYCYMKRILPILNKKHVVQLTKFDYRLSNKLNPNLQKLRCRVNYHALRFIDPILDMGKLLVERMRMKSKYFIALHLRFEPDMLAFSGCDYGGGEAEKNELGTLRKRWKGLHDETSLNYRPEQSSTCVWILARSPKSDPEKQRRQGRCPLTPKEVGVMLRALGYDSDVHIYVASGEVYRGEETLAPLKTLFPNFHSKDTIANKEELSPFTTFSARMAALDFIVCDESDVFVSNNNGNMAKILAGRRRYFGHKRTIRPNAKKLHRLLLNRDNMTWEDFTSNIRTTQIGFMGEPNEINRERGEFHENPASCICKNSSIKIRFPNTQNQSSSSENELSRDELEEDEHDLVDTHDMENESEIGHPRTHYDTEKLRSSLFLKAKQSEYEELLSD